MLTERRGSNLFLGTGRPLALRLDDTIEPLGTAPLDEHDIEAAVLPALPDHVAQRYRAHGIADTSLTRGRLGRFRLNIHRERGRAAVTIGVLPTEPPRLPALNLPDGIARLTQITRGMVLVGGPTGSGKTTTLAALVDVISRRDEKHIITIEHPIEYEHPHR